MKKKKIPKGIFVLAILMMWSAFSALENTFNLSNDIKEIMLSPLMILTNLIFGLSYTVFGLWLLKLKEWARKGTIWLHVISFFWLVFGFPEIIPMDNSVSTLIFIISLTYTIIVIYYLTRSKIKEQFQ